jgi:hypothetical protein
MTVDVCDIFLEAARALRGIEFNFDNNFARCDMESPSKAKKG